MPSREDKKTGGPFDFQGTALPNSALFVTRQNSHYAELGIRDIFIHDSSDGHHSS
jgi:hypothetical protein